MERDWERKDTGAPGDRVLIKAFMNASVWGPAGLKRVAKEKEVSDCAGRKRQRGETRGAKKVE